MKKAYINSTDKETFVSEYLVQIEYDNGNIFEENIVNYSYSNLFEWIKENHQYDNDQKVRSIKIYLIDGLSSQVRHFV